MNGFTSQPLSSPGVFARLLARPVKENAFREIENMFAENPIGSLSKSQIDDILVRYKLRDTDCVEGLKEIFIKAIRHLVRLGRMTPEDHATLGQYASVLGISDEVARETYLSIVIPMYESLAIRAFADLQLSEQEKEAIQQFISEFKIPESVAKKTLEELAQALLQTVVDGAIIDKRLSPQEDEVIRITAKNLGVTRLDFDSDSTTRLEHLRTLWRYAQGNLPSIDVPIRLQKSEACATCIGVNQYELKTITRRIRYGGPTVSIRILPGVRWRMGDIGVSRVTEDVLKMLDKGTLYFTNKRLIFDGSSKTTSIPLKRILNYRLFSDGLLIEKDAGKDQIFEFGAIDIEELDAILEGLMANDA